MGIDAELYIWGPDISDEDLPEWDRKLKENGVTTWRGDYPVIKRESPNWNPAPELDLFEIDLDCSRSFGEHFGKGHWPTLKEKIRTVQRLFPDHFVLFTDDQVTFGEESKDPVDEARLERLDKAWAISPYNKSKEPAGE